MSEDYPVLLILVFPSPKHIFNSINPSSYDRDYKLLTMLFTLFWLKIALLKRGSKAKHDSLNTLYWILVASLKHSLLNLELRPNYEGEIKFPINECLPSAIKS